MQTVAEHRKTAYNRAKAIEEYLLKQYKEIGSLKFEDYATAMINSWIAKLDRAFIAKIADNLFEVPTPSLLNSLSFLGVFVGKA